MYRLIKKRGNFMDENKNKWGRLKFFKGKKIYVFLSLCLLLVGTLVFLILLNQLKY